MLARAAASWCVGSAEAACDFPCGGFLTLSDHAELLFLRRFFLMDVQLLVMLLGGAGDSSQRFVLLYRVVHLVAEHCLLTSN